MFELTFLGTAGADHPWGESCNVLVSHEHADHLLGIGGLAYSIGLTRAIRALRVFAPPVAMQRIERLLDMVDLKGPLEISLTPIIPGLFYEDEAMTCVAFETGHTETSCGFLLEEREKRPFLAERASQLGVPEGRIRGVLAAGEVVQLPDGTEVGPDEVLGEPQRGLTIAYVSDSVPGPHLANHCHQADCLVAHGTYLARDEALAREHGHLTVKEVIELACEAEIPRVCITHMSSRYSHKEIVAEAKELRPDVIVPSDLDELQVSRGRTRA